MVIQGTSSRTTLGVLLVGAALVLFAAAYAWWAASTAHAYGPSAFVMIVKTDNPGTSTAQQFTIPTVGTGYNYSVDCNDDGTPEFTAATGSVTCTYATPGTYTVAITGTFRRINFNNTGDRHKLLEVRQWGTAAWTSMQSAFYGASNMRVTATDAPNLSGVTTMVNMFRGAATFNENINHWDVSTVRNLESTFASATSFNQPLNNWNTSNVTRLYATFQNATSFNQPLDNWDVSKVTTMYYTFDGASSFNGALNGWDTGLVNDMRVMFRGATSFNQPIDNWDVRNVTSMAQMFSSATVFNQPLNSWETTSLVTTNGMFYGTAAFNQPLGNWDMSGVANTSSMFYANRVFDQNLGSWDVSNVTNMGNMFGGSSTAARGKLSTANYDATLIGWLANGVQNNVTLDAGRSQYCTATPERLALVATYGWSIADNGRACPPAHVVIVAPTKLRNVPITDTTIIATAGYDGLTITAADVTLAAGTTAGTSGFSCVQTSAVRVDCTVQITSSGNLAVRAVNSEGSDSTTTEANYVIDTVLPTTNANIDTASGIHTPTLTFTAADNIGVDRVEVTYNSNNSAAGVGAPVTITPATSPLVLALDPDESIHTVTIRTYDRAGNVYEQQILFPPIVSFTTPTTLSNAPITNATVTITSPSGNDIDTIALSGTAGASLGPCIGAGGDTASPYAQPVTCQIANVASTGTVVVTARDAGNGAVGSNTASFVIDTVPPVVAVAAPVKVANSAITSVTVTVTDDRAINPTDVAISILQDTGNLTISNVVCEALSASQVQCTLQIDASEGTGALRVVATDAAGNETTAQELGFRIDTTAPATTRPALDDASNSGALSDTVTSTVQPVVHFYCSEADAMLEILIDGGLVGVLTCTTVGDHTFTLPDALTDGVHTVTYHATDALGNRSVASQPLVLTIDTIVPTVEIVLPADQPAVTDQNHATFVVRGSEALAALTESMLTIDGSATAYIESITAHSPTEWLVRLAQLTDGDVVRLGLADGVVLDIAGNAASGIAPADAPSVTYEQPAAPTDEGTVVPSNPTAPNTGALTALKQYGGALSLFVIALGVLFAAFVVRRNTQR